MLSSPKIWYAVYTRPRWEKKVYRLFNERGIEAYCPLNRVRKKWSDRIKWVEEPLFKSYVFVQVAEEEKPCVRMVDGVVNFVYWLGRPAAIKNKEIELIRKFLNDYDEVQAVPVDLAKDTKVIIRQGVLMDKQATVLTTLKNKVKVQVSINGIGYLLVATVDKSNLSMAAK